MINSDRIEYLYNRYANAQATPEELAELFGLSTDPDAELVFQNLMSGNWEQLQETATRLETLKMSPPRQLRRSFRWAAAASLLILFTAGYLLLTKKTMKSTLQQPVAVVQSSDIAPGSNKAILYLANGAKILLDSARNGRLATLGNTIVTKSDSGKLTVENSAESPGPEPNGINTLETPRGGIYTVILPDGTTAWLNAQSKLIYPTRFSGLRRDVRITGEVYFEVAHDAAHPFVVSLPAMTRNQGENEHWMQVEVLGTHFNINAYEGARITLIEGSVRITTSKESTKIKPGQQATTTFAHPTIAVKDSVDLEKVMAWKNGEMVLTKSTVEQLMNEISRWYDVDIRYASTVPDKKFFGSVNRNVPLSSVLSVLKAYGIETRLDQRNKMLTVQ